MTWPPALAEHVARELGRHGADAWLMHLDRLDARRVEAEADGISLQHGESTCLSFALWWDERVATASLLIAPGRVDELMARVAASLRSVSPAASHAGPAPPAPTWREGRWSSWQGDWRALADRWRPLLLAPLRGAGIGVRHLTLSLERRRLLLRDHAARTREVTRHAARIAISCRGGSGGHGAWTMTVPLDTPEPRALEPHIGRAMRHARLRGCRSAAVSGSGPVRLEPTALAQMLSIAHGGRALLPAGARQTPAAYRDDLGFPDDPSDGPADRDPVLFDHATALPATGRSPLWIAPGTMSSSRSARGGLTVWHLDEVLSTGATNRLATLVSGTVGTGTGSRDVSGVRLSLPWRAVRTALRDPVRRGRVPLAITFGEADYHVPALALGELAWAPR